MAVSRLRPARLLGHDDVGMVLPTAFLGMVGSPQPVGALGPVGFGGSLLLDLAGASGVFEPVSPTHVVHLPSLPGSFGIPETPRSGGSPRGQEMSCT